MTDKTHKDVVNILTKIKKSHESNNTQSEDEVICPVAKDAPKPEVRGNPKSGRFWKSKKERYVY